MKTVKTIVLVFVICIFGVCGYVYAQQQDGLKLNGPQNVQNSKFRQHFYAQQFKKMEKNFEDDFQPNNPEKVSGHFGLLLDRMLGVDFQKDKKVSIVKIQKEMLAKKNIVAGQYLSGGISFEEYVNQTSVILENSLKCTAEMLSDDEFFALFQFEKSEIEGSFYRLINQGLPENEQLIDPR